jgi:uncharacterized membrane protein (UPF0127 family)
MSCLIRTETNEILVENLLVKKTSWGRLRGLLLFRKLASDTGMLLISTKGVHTFGMLFPLDIYFFNESMRLIAIQSCVLPWRLPKSPEGTQHILEVHHFQDVAPLKLDVGEQVSVL